MNRIRGQFVVPLGTPPTYDDPADPFTFDTGYFQKDPAQAPTQVNADFMNQLQEELCNLVEAAGGTLDSQDDTQLATLLGPLWEAQTWPIALATRNAESGTWAVANSLALTESANGSVCRVQLDVPVGATIRGVSMRATPGDASSQVRLEIIETYPSTSQLFQLETSGTGIQTVETSAEADVVEPLKRYAARLTTFGGGAAARSVFGVWLLWTPPGF